MKAIIYPGKCHGEVNIPTSKSVAHRMLICASLSKGESIIRNVSMSNDISATISCLNNLGAKITIEDNIIKVIGIKEKDIKKVELDANESGSTLRFLIPLSSFLANEVKFKGSEKLISRPLKIYKELYKKENLHFDLDSNELLISGSLNDNYYKIDGSVSSQFISGLLFYLPLLNHDSIIEIVGDYQSKSYTDLTIDALKLFGVEVIEREEGRKLLIKGNQEYKPVDTCVEGDYSQAAFFLVLGAINNDIKVNGLNLDSKQGDKDIVRVLKESSVNLEISGNYIISKKSNICSKDINLKDIPDLGPILSVLFANANGNSKLYNAKRLRYKESDRILATETELNKFGISISSDEDNIYITGKKSFEAKDVIDSHNDHRIFMSAAILSTISQSPVIISNYECINKSYPEFLNDLIKLGIRVEIRDE